MDTETSSPGDDPRSGVLAQEPPSADSQSSLKDCLPKEYSASVKYRYARWIFLRLFGVINLIAFSSLAAQVIPLLGSQGLLPAEELFKNPTGNWLHFLLTRPTIFYWNHTDFALQIAAWVGACVAILLILDIAPLICAAVLWALYLSFVTIARDFLSFQWDNLLLESGVLAIFLAPWRLAPRLSRSAIFAASPPSRVLIFLFQFLVFRLNFESGLSKLLSGDLHWRNLTAMDFYYETAPLPTWIGWYVHHLPHWFHACETVLTFVLELGIAWMVFGPRTLRIVAFFPLLGLQLFIGSTANYGFFNYLSAALLVFLLDDSIFGWIFTKLRIHGKGSTGAPASTTTETFVPQPPPTWKVRARKVKQVVVLLAGIFYVIIAYSIFARVFLSDPDTGESPSFLRSLSDFVVMIAAPVQDQIQPFRAINCYHLFAVMTTERYEIEMQGSDNPPAWKPYEFNHKPGDPKRRPDIVAPHQPRLDFQHWFLIIRHGEIEDFENALRDPRYFSMLIRSRPFFANFLRGLMVNSPSAKAFLAIDPFPEKPPTLVRVLVYRYTMASMEEHKAEGIFWNRKLIAEWGPLETKPQR